MGKKMKSINHKGHKEGAKIAKKKMKNLHRVAQRLHRVAQRNQLLITLPNLPPFRGAGGLS
jgi:hypothetical protein